MPRCRRLLVKDGYYHVFNRGIGRKRIRFLEQHAQLFFHHLSYAAEKHDINILAYCLMENHYHLMIHTPNPNLDRAMQTFGAGFSQAINREIGSDGAVFKSRYRSILVQTGAYKVQLLRYIHLNPVEANLAAHPGDYPYSSFNHYLEKKQCPSWLKTTPLMADFLSQEAFIEFHQNGNSSQFKSIYSKKHLYSSI